jgi:hypothetical protein
MPMKEAFRKYLEEKPTVKAIFVGTRRTDPHGALLTHFDPTDHGWPPFMRVHPVIDWHYAEIWTVSLSSLPTTTLNYTCCFSIKLTSHLPVYTTSQDSLLLLIRSWVHILGRHNRYTSKSSFESWKHRGGKEDFQASVRACRGQSGKIRPGLVITVSLCCRYN